MDQNTSRPTQKRLVFWAWAFSIMWIACTRSLPQKTVEPQPGDWFTPVLNYQGQIDGSGTAGTLAFKNHVLEVERPGQWKGTARVEWRAAVYELEFEQSNGQPWIDFRLRSQTLHTHSIEFESLEFNIPDIKDAHYVDRSLQWRSVAKDPHFVDRWTPWRMRWTDRRDQGWVFAAARFPQGRTPGLWVSQQKGASSTDLHIKIELDHFENRPFFSYADCPSDPTPLTKLKVGVKRWNAAPRTAGETKEFRWRLYVGSADAHDLPIQVPARFPGGYRSAVIVTDHADQSSLSKTKPIVDAFSDRHLKMTKTVFVKSTPGYYRQLDSLEFSELMRRFQEHGAEIGLHSVSGAKDTTEETAQKVRLFRQKYFGKTWIDHQPHTNCEALTSQGARASSPFYSLQVLREQGFAYAWSGYDLPRPDESLNLWRASDPGHRTVVFFEHSALPGITLFPSYWFHVELGVWQAAFTTRSIDQLVRDRGLWIGHTYLDTFQEKGPHARLQLIEKSPFGSRPFVLRAGFAALLDEWERRQSKHEMGALTIAEVVGHLQSTLSEFPPLPPDSTGSKVDVDVLW